MLDRTGTDHFPDKTEPDAVDIAAPSAAPSDDEVIAVLDRMVLSTEFLSSPHLAAFLRFSVETTLAGEGQKIKAYSVATSVLGRPPTFDPQADPIVRVEATRLRRAMERYYLHEGSDEPILIDIPRGRYVAVFSYRKHATEPFPAGSRADGRSDVPLPSAPELSRTTGAKRGLIDLVWSNLNSGERSSLAVFAFALAGAAITWSVIPLFETRQKPIEQAFIMQPSTPQHSASDDALGTQRVMFATLQLTAFDSYSDAPEHHELSHRLTHLIAEQAPDFDGIPVIDPDGPMAADPPGDHLYALMGTILQEAQHPERVELSIRLVHRPSYEIIWAKTYETDSGMSLFDPKLAAIRDDIVRSVTGLNGAIRVDDAHRHLDAKTASTPCQMCLAESDIALRTGDPERIAKSILCLTSLSETSPSDALVYKQLAALRLRDQSHNADHDNAIISAERDLEKAILLAPADYSTLRELDRLRHE